MVNIGRYNMRGLSDDFLNSLKSNHGLLKPVLDRVKKDDTLMLAIRNGYINIYYRGGNLLRIAKTNETSDSYDLYFDKRYDLSVGYTSFFDLNLPSKISGREQIAQWISAFPKLKELMDFWFSENPKTEREFQQLVERENNRSSISNETEYFIIDIEMADANLGARFDILAIKWLANGRKDGKSCKASFIEMKYGDDALSGDSGLVSHLKDINNLLADKGKYASVLETMTTQFHQLDDLGLINYNHGTKNSIIGLNPTNKPEFIFLLANHNPRSRKLEKILTSDDFKVFANSDNFDLRFFVCSDAGYGMHNNNMLTHEEYLNRFNRNEPI